MRALDWAPTRARLLPPDTTDFTGRLCELAALTNPATFPSHAAALFVLTGSGGTGKTALAVRAARLAGDSFPDAHLYADLGGYTGVPTPVPDVLRRFLRALGATGPLPEDQDELVGMFRTALAGQRCLVVLDDAADEAQVRPLLPAGPDALAIVTSRNWLGGLAGALPLRLGPMPDAEAAAMLARALGPRWTGKEDVDGLLALCGYLPLAIRIAAARLLSRPQMSVDDLCDQLRDERRRLKRLTAGDITVQGVLTSSYEALDGPDREVFRRLALLRGYDFCPEAAARVAGITREEAQEALDRMADRSVVRAESEPGRYSLHSLARLFAADRLAADEDADTVRAAEAGHLRWLLGRVRAAADLVDPAMVRLPAAEIGDAGALAASGEGAGPDGVGEARETERTGETAIATVTGHTATPSIADHRRTTRSPRDTVPVPTPAPAHREAALAWLDAERHNLLALVRHHRRFGDPAVCWTVPDALRGYYQQRRRLRDWIRMAEIGLAAAQGARNLRAQAAMHLSLGMAAFASDRLAEAEDHYQRTVALGLNAGWQEIEAAAYRCLAGIALALGDTATSEKYLSLWADLNETLEQRLDADAALLTAEQPQGEAQPGSPAVPMPEPDAAAAKKWSVLSRREQTVARLVVQGLTNQQIAKRIRCSPETVKFHLRNIFRKLAIGSRVEIARFVLVSSGPR
ncbi:LuxR C-terminal-related transcriptional regulator [Catenulispora pinisilvae]|uniref:LuxR C-terminal-related transcriptional regulator n=1 Tax=Catenulispora pinisilvae TaxID=2705253 RepID=UPI0018916CF0|nr:LuxR C-terminal-related transcriptional regulator [Catenulispora pinisilvae]